MSRLPSRQAISSDLPSHPKRQKSDVTIISSLQLIPQMKTSDQLSKTVAMQVEPAIALPAAMALPAVQNTQRSTEVPRMPVHSSTRAELPPLEKRGSCRGDRVMWQLLVAVALIRREFKRSVSRTVWWRGRGTVVSGTLREVTLSRKSPQRLRISKWSKRLEMEPTRKCTR